MAYSSSNPETTKILRSTTETSENPFFPTTRASTQQSGSAGATNSLPAVVTFVGTTSATTVMSIKTKFKHLLYGALSRLTGGNTWLGHCSIGGLLELCAFIFLSFIILCAHPVQKG